MTLFPSSPEDALKGGGCEGKVCILSPCVNLSPLKRPIHGLHRETDSIPFPSPSFNTQNDIFTIVFE